MSLVPVTFGNLFFSTKNGTYWAKLKRVKMAWTFLPNTAQFFASKIGVKLTPKIKFFDIDAELVVKLPFFSEKCIFSGRKVIYLKSSLYTKMFSDPKYSSSVCQKYFFWSNPKLIFFTEFNLHIVTLCWPAMTLLTILHQSHLVWSLPEH